MTQRKVGSFFLGTSVSMPSVFLFHKPHVSPDQWAEPRLVPESTSPGRNKWWVAAQTKETFSKRKHPKSQNWEPGTCFQVGKLGHLHKHLAKSTQVQPTFESFILPRNSACMEPNCALWIYSCSVLVANGPSQCSTTTYTQVFFSGSSIQTEAGGCEGSNMYVPFARNKQNWVTGLILRERSD